VVKEKKPIHTYYDGNVQAAIESLIARHNFVVKPEELVAYELAALACSGYDPSYGNVMAQFTFPTQFKADAELVVLLGLPKANVEEGENQLVWSVQKATVVNNQVKILFLGAELEKMQTTPALLVVMSAPMTE